MSYNKPIRLTVANRRDFIIPMGLLVLLAVLSALLSPHPYLMTVFTVLILCAGWGIFALGFPNINNTNLTLIIFTDGRVELKSAHKDTIEGFLDGQQWCTHRVAVLRVADGESLRRLVILSVQQQNSDNFRRLNMWLRQDFFNQKSEGRV